VQYGNQHGEEKLQSSSARWSDVNQTSLEGVCPVWQQRAMATISLFCSEWNNPQKHGLLLLCIFLIVELPVAFFYCTSNLAFNILFNKCFMGVVLTVNFFGSRKGSGWFE
jgi:hypothetical protein